MPIPDLSHFVESPAHASRPGLRSCSHRRQEALFQLFHFLGEPLVIPADILFRGVIHSDAPLGDLYAKLMPLNVSH
jgi:hypothetical protein